MSLNLPSELVAFLGAGKRLRYWSKFTEMGAVTLKSPGELQLENIAVVAPSTAIDQDPRQGQLGYYVAPVVDLCKSASYTAPQGLLLWVPRLKAFGTWDCDHQVLSIFPGASWSRIRWRPRYYLEAQWGSPFGTAKTTDVRPWEHGYEFRGGEPGPDMLTPVYGDERDADFDDDVRDENAER